MGCVARKHIKPCREIFAWRGKAPPGRARGPAPTHHRTISPAPTEGGIFIRRHRQEGYQTPSRALRRAGTGTRPTHHQMMPRELRRAGAGTRPYTPPNNIASTCRRQAYSSGGIARKDIKRRREHCVGRAWEPAPTYHGGHRKETYQTMPRDFCMAGQSPARADTRPAPTDHEDASQGKHIKPCRKIFAWRGKAPPGRARGPAPTDSWGDIARKIHGAPTRELRRAGVGARPYISRSASQGTCLGDDARFLHGGAKPRQGGHKARPYRSPTEYVGRAWEPAPTHHQTISPVPAGTGIS